MARIYNSTNKNKLPRKINRRTYVSKTKKTMFRCEGGPWHGQSLCLQADGKTLPFTVNGELGFYKSSRPMNGVTWWNPC